MALSEVNAPRIAGICTTVPVARFNNLKDTVEFPPEEVKKVVSMAGVTERRLVTGNMRGTDLCYTAASALLNDLDWDGNSIDALIMVTQTPDYFLPSSSCIVHRRLNLSDRCASFDVGQGCSGYVYGLWLAAMMLASGGMSRVLLLHGETPTLYAAQSDRSVALLFGDAGSATALETEKTQPARKWHFTLNTDGKGYRDLIVEAGAFRDRFCKDRRKHYLKMEGANVFRFTINVIPQMIDDILLMSGMRREDVDYYIFHQSNRFIMKHLISKCGLSADKVPIILDRYGNVGGPSIPLTITQGIEHDFPPERPLKMVLLGYGVGLSWAGVLIDIDHQTQISHRELTEDEVETE